MKQTWMMSLFFLTFSSALAPNARAQDPQTRAPQTAPQPAQHARRHGPLARRLHELVRALDPSPAQREQALSIARAAQPIRKELRERIARERDQGRAHVRELVRGAYQQLEPQVHGLVGTLTPEQRTRLADLAKRHGRTFDEQRLERRLTFLLSRPGAAARIQANLDR